MFIISILSISSLLWIFFFLCFTLVFDTISSLDYCAIGTI